MTDGRTSSDENDDLSRTLIYLKSMILYLKTDGMKMIFQHLNEAIYKKMAFILIKTD